MTTTMVAPALQGFVDNCRLAWADSLSRILDSPCEVHILQEKGALPSAAPVCLVLTAEGAISGEAAFMMDQRNASMLAAKCGANAAVQAVQETVRQTIVLAINLFQKQFGPTRVQFAAGSILHWKPETVLALVAANRGADALRAYLLLSPQISGNVPPPVPVAPSAMASPVATAPEVMTRIPAERNLSLVMGVQLEVILRFGQKRLPLKQLVELNAGAVVELDKRVQEPVELLLRDKVFARGEVVIVDGNYGLRITEVYANQESL